MKKGNEGPREDDLRPEYSAELIRQGVRGKYSARYRAGSNLVLLAPDVAAAFPDEKTVNEALRMLLKIAQSSVRPSTKSKAYRRAASRVS